MRARIISDGTPNGTQVLDENGVDLMKTFGVMKLEWVLEGKDRFARLTIVTDLAEADVVGEISETGEAPEDIGCLDAAMQTSTAPEL